MSWKPKKPKPLCRVPGCKKPAMTVRSEYCREHNVLKYKYLYGVAYQGPHRRRQPVPGDPFDNMPELADPNAPSEEECERKAAVIRALAEEGRRYKINHTIGKAWHA